MCIINEDADWLKIRKYDPNVVHKKFSPSENVGLPDKIVGLTN